MCKCKKSFQLTTVIRGSVLCPWTPLGIFICPCRPTLSVRAPRSPYGAAKCLKGMNWELTSKCTYPNSTATVDCCLISVCTHIYLITSPNPTQLNWPSVELSWVGWSIYKDSDKNASILSVVKFWTCSQFHDWQQTGDHNARPDSAKLNWSAEWPQRPTPIESSRAMWSRI